MKLNTLFVSTVVAGAITSVWAGSKFDQPLLTDFQVDKKASIASEINQSGFNKSKDITRNTVKSSSINSDQLQRDDTVSFFQSTPKLEQRYIVKFKKGSSATFKNAQGNYRLNSHEARKSISKMGGVVRRELPLSNAVSVVLNSKSRKQLTKNSMVETIEEDHPRQLFSQTTPWGITGTQSNLISDTSASNRVVCIIDSGYDITSPDLVGNNHSGFDDIGTGHWFEPSNSHGTHVAGIIAAVNNDEGIQGVLPNQQVSLHVIKVFGEDGWGYSSDLSEAVRTCVANGANVINMSLGGSLSTELENEAMQEAYNNDVLLVAAAGNAGTERHAYPASYDSVISVGAVDANKQWANFSQYTDQLELAAPGEAVLSTVSVGDGALGFISTTMAEYGNDNVVPLMRIVNINDRNILSYYSGRVTGEIAECTSLNNGNYDCGNMNNKICLVERRQNQWVGKYYESDPVGACFEAGAKGVIVYSNAEKPALQNPFLIDENSQFDFVALSVSRELGLELANQEGNAVTIRTETGKDYSYYNGTSMASPYVASIAALVWSHHPDCTNAEIRTALIESALDIDADGRDVRTGFGIVQAKEAMEFLASNQCGEINDVDEFVLINNVEKTNLALSRGYDQVFTMYVPEEADSVRFTTRDGTGDADLYVSFESVPTDGSYDCRKNRSGNNASCTLSEKGGTYYVRIKAYRAFEGLTLVGSYTEAVETVAIDLANDAPVSNLNAWEKEELFFRLAVPVGATNIRFETSGGTGDVDMYVKFDSPPTSSSFDCRSMRVGNSESCSESQGGGVYFIKLLAFRDFEGVTLTARYH
ncbi:S8 family serine peptidase [Pleionea sediminis]|uniref:S8 family serine peptidase n=1 Tax=Pleionea sediminis TaxID=2569479 RepID=UPI001186BC19|nr:S8 family serine peptidase [Pleionea sediminis]